MRLRTRDLAAVVQFLGEATEVEAAEPFTPELLDRLLDLVPCEFANYFAYDRRAGVVSAYVECSVEPTDPQTVAPFTLPPDELAQVERTSALIERHYARSPSPLMTWSDVFPRIRRIRHELDPDAQREWGTVDHGCVKLDASPVRKVWLTFSSAGRDFDERDRELMRLLQPHFAAWYRSAERRRELELISNGERSNGQAPLSAREWDVIRCVAAGKSNGETARALWVTTGTVRKHLDNVYAKLGVRSRTAALAALGMTREPL